MSYITNEINKATFINWLYLLGNIIQLISMLFMLVYFFIMINITNEILKIFLLIKCLFDTNTQSTTTLLMLEYWWIVTDCWIQKP